jgi:hypothetical protein
MVDTLTSRQARHVIEVVGSSGTPPEWGFQFFSTGLDGYLRVIEEDYLRSFLREGGSSFKVVVGTYGGGKTHFLYSVRELAWRHDFLVAYCPLSAETSPFYRLDKVYRSIAMNLMRPLTPDELLGGAERGLGAFLKTVYAGLVEALTAEGLKGEELRKRLTAVAADSTRGLENPNFGRAVRLALEALVHDDPDTFDQMLQYLTVDGYDRVVHRNAGILQPIERGQAFATIRSLVTWIRNLRFRGLVILFDEAEQAGAMTSKQKEMMLANLRELVDQCGSAAFANVMVFYAVPNEQFLVEGRSPAYEALRQRIQTVFDFTNPTGVTIRLDRLAREPRTLLTEIGNKLSGVYETAYRKEFPLELKTRLVSLLADAAAERAFGDIGYKRLFVQGLVRALHMLRLGKNVTVDEDFARRMLATGTSEPDGEGLDGDLPEG